MKQIAEFPDKFLPQAYRSLTFIRHQLSDLTAFCDCMLQDGLVSPQGFLELDNVLQKVLHETRTVCSPPLKKPKKSDFDMVKPLARGAFGTVSHIRHKQTRQSFAMKEIKRVENRRYEVLMERDVLAFLDHPLVVSMFCSFETEKHHYMVMEYLGGGDFSKLLQYYTHLSPEASCFYAAELVLALEYLHRYGVIHRDLKPGNLLISSEGHLKVADFGVSKLDSVATADNDADAEQVAREFSDGESCGTLFYMAPELYLGTGYGKPIDWWAAGCILFNFLTGSHPFSAGHMDDYDEVVIAGHIHWPEKKELLSPEARSILSLLLDTDPVTRLGTRGASEVKQHPFFKVVDWEEVIFVTPPFACELEDVDVTSSSQLFPPPVDDQSGSPADTADTADFCYVAYRFKEVYGSPRPLSLATLQNRFPEAEMPESSKEQQEPEEWNGHFVYATQLQSLW